VVGETVSAAKLWPRAQRGSGFLNAVLRKVVADHSHFNEAPLEALWPTWLQTLSIQGLGADATNALVKAQTVQPATYLVPRNGDAHGLAQALNGRVIAKYGVEIDDAPIDKLPGFEPGDWWVQDIAATLPARILNAKAGEIVLDICAAPGGKTMQLAATGATVTAIDRSKPRLKRLKQNLWRTGFKEQVSVVHADATTWTPPAPVDKILLDAPCSALGTLRRHPESPWIKSAEDVDRFPDIQERLLRASLNMLKPGGTLVSCVCSPFPHEGIDVVARVLSDLPVQRINISPEHIPEFETSKTALGDLLTLPNGEFGHDAFYIAHLRREF